MSSVEPDKIGQGKARYASETFVPEANAPMLTQRHLNPAEVGTSFNIHKEEPRGQTKGHILQLAFVTAHTYETAVFDSEIPLPLLVLREAGTSLNLGASRQVTIGRMAGMSRAATW